ncbi:hypothetical protein [Streptomyces sp. NPDC097981]|uniref:hypothetical protein n=1 Tax=Streptomyces sp. NPDC097981 TaxID=3155428 RepID=UPI003328557E
MTTRWTRLLGGPLAAVVAVPVLGACTAEAGGAPRAAPSTAPGHGRLTGPCTVHRETDPVSARFPELGPVASTAWCGMQPSSGARVPGPTDVRLFGVLTPQDAAAVRMYLDDPSYAFAPATPEDVPAEIRSVLPADARWLSSRKFDTLVGGGRDDGDFYFDRASGQVVFDCMNPRRKDGGPASPAASG